ncbi:MULTISPECIES: hypothetical protein [Hydrogenophaga]|uniref:Uncharacterized protein n=1 Tax=Hydrogenophaga intermedia TaxID=65786 RepID=A0A1L1PNF0_HYDIT|nr:MULTISPECIES: hypothetical protein [Hydrogenophaga]TMU78046.1 hypothetical protein FGJ01_01505 [Hydrogenophaga intermedia]CDN88477.1 hypothetical protein BN948_02911 [Hydrogenophaga intermedia]
MTRIASYFRAPTKPKVADRADRQALKRTVIDSKTGEINFDHLNKLLGHYPNARTLYAKKDWLGRLYVSFNEPEDGKYEYADKKALGTLAKLGLTDSFVGYKQAVFDAKQDLLSNLNSHGGGFEVTSKFRQAALTLEKAQKDGPAKQETAPPAPASQNSQPNSTTATSLSMSGHELKIETPAPTVVAIEPIKTQASDTPTIDAEDLDLMDAIDNAISVLDARTAFAIQKTNSEVSDSLVDGGRLPFARTLLSNLPQPPEVANDQPLSDLDKLNYYLDKTNLLKQVGKGDHHALTEYRSELLKAEEKQQAI